MRTRIQAEGDRPSPLAAIASAFRRAGMLYADLKRENLPRMVLGIVALMLAVAGLVFLVENRAEGGMFRRYFDAVWWSVVTWATVGYGDTYPVTTAGRLLGILLIFASVAVTAVLSGTIASIFVDRKIREGKGLQHAKLRDHLVVCGWNRNTEGMLEGLARIAGRGKAHIVLVNEMDSEAFQECAARHRGMDLRFVRGNFTSETVLRRASVNAARTAVLVSDESGANTLAKADERTILATLAIKSMNPDIVTSAELVNAENAGHLRRANVDDVIVGGEFNGFLLASGASAPGIPELAREILSFEGRNVVQQAAVPAGWSGKTFADLSQHLLASGRGVLLGVLAEEKKMSLDDILAGDSSAVDDFIKRKFAESETDYFEEAPKALDIRVNPGAAYVLRDTDRLYLVGPVETAP
ncbi:MAG: NAD-binding protein [Spirochaetes bacterium]|nr:NAD-binding protein [Spirochaetota bacterium]